MKQIIFFKKTWVFLLFLFIWNIELPAQQAWGGASFVSPGNNSCNAGRIHGGQNNDVFNFPFPTGLTVNQINHLETDFQAIYGYSDPLYFVVTVQSTCGLISIIFFMGNPGGGTPNPAWINSGNLASPLSLVLLNGCGQSVEMPYSDAQALYGAATVLNIQILASQDDYPDIYIDFDNTIINNRTYNYDDCDEDGLLDIYDCDPAHNNNNKVRVCHNGQSICVAMSALQTHLYHGDYMGSCNTNTRPGNILREEVSIYELKLHPNPATNQIKISNNNNKALGTVSIYDISGKMIYKKFIGSSQATIDIKKFSPGFYYLRSDQIEKAIKFVKQ